VKCGDSYISPDKTCHIDEATGNPAAGKRNPLKGQVEPSGARDEDGRIKRSEAAKQAFERQTGHPNGWEGHVVDHIIPLACGGADEPSNMQWQTTEEAKAKDKVERKGCSPGHP